MDCNASKGAQVPGPERPLFERNKDINAAFSLQRSELFYKEALVLPNVLQILVRSICYVIITWYRFAPDGSGKASRLSGQARATSNQAKRGA
jgi:hypothetical protein